jgi:hypothetical protein
MWISKPPIIPPIPDIATQFAISDARKFPLVQTKGPLPREKDETFPGKD